MWPGLEQAAGGADDEGILDGGSERRNVSEWTEAIVTAAKAVLVA